MSEDASAIERRVEQLESRLEALTAECAELEERIFMLYHGKIPDPRALYYNWVLEWSADKDVRNQIQSLSRILDDRIGGEPVDQHHRSIVKGVPEELLDGSGPPPIADVIDAFKAVTGIPDAWIIKDLLRAIQRQLGFRSLSAYLMMHRSDL